MKTLPETSPDGLVPAEIPDRTTDLSRMENDLVEGRDYYLEGTAMVFTAAYLKRRGYCCESGCRHCPYEKS